MGPNRLSNCIIRNTEATDSIDDVVRALGKLGTPEDPPPSVEDGLDLFSDLCSRFRVVDSPAIFIIYLFPILVV